MGHRRRQNIHSAISSNYYSVEGDDIVNMDIKVKKKLKFWGTRECNLNMYYPWSPGVIFELEKYFGMGYTQQFGYFKKELFHWAEDFEHLYDIGEYILKKCLKDKGYFDKMYKDWKIDTEEFLTETKALGEMNLEKKSYQELLKIHDNIKELNKKIIKGYITDVMQMYLMEEMKRRLAKYLTQNTPRFNMCYAVLTAPLDLSVTAEEEIALLNIAKIETEPDRKDLVKKHTEKYFWLGGNYAGRHCFDEKYFTEKLKEHLNKTTEEIDKEIEKKESVLVRAKQEKEKAIKELNLDKEFVEVIKILERIAAFHDERKESLVAPVYYRIPLRDEIANRVGITRYELNWLIPQEISDALKRGKLNQEDEEKIASRGQRCAAYSTKDGTIVVAGKEAEELFDRLVEKEESNEIKGTVANPGKAKGVVKVLGTVKDISKMEKGDILVTGMTTPDYVPAMKLASAIVTNEGGITCHAAIVSRELGVPCIIGTKNATRVLKDGDMVEVDAENGVVKVLDE